LRSLKFRRDTTSAIEFLAAHFDISQGIAAKAYPHALEILTADGEISTEKVRQILLMMQDLGRKEPMAINPAALIDFSFLREVHKERKVAAKGDRR
jgi:hypothetical protein